MKVSVHMITYNHAKYIAQAIESVLMQQTDFDFELIIGEDCSTDGTREIVIEYQRRYPHRIRALLPEKNLGVRRNSDEVFSNCRGEYIALLEGDDVWTDRHKLQKQVRFMDANRSFSMCGTATRVVVCSKEGVESQGRLIRPDVLKPHYDVADFLAGYPMQASSIVLRRGMVSLPSWMNRVSNGDFCFFALHAEKGPVGYLDEVTSNYRVHDGGLWTSKSLLERIRCQQEADDLLDIHFEGRYRSLLRRREYGDSVAASRTLAGQGMFREARKIYREAIRRHLRVMPLRVVAWGLAVYLARPLRRWHQVTMYVAIRTRVRRLLSVGSDQPSLESAVPRCPPNKPVINGFDNVAESNEKTVEPIEAH